MTATRALPQITIIGGGPAGLMAAEAASGGGATVHLFDAMASCGRKFLVAGKGGLNLTHRDHGAALLAQFSQCKPDGGIAPATGLASALAAFDGDAIRNWASDLGIESFIGTSGRVFPADLKAAPLLRRWLRRLRAGGVQFHPRHRFVGWDERGRVRFATPQGERLADGAATVLALGGASWPRLGSDGRWASILSAQGIDVAGLRAANCGFECDWSDFMRDRHAGAPVKSVALELTTIDGEVIRRRGEFVISEYGIEGSVVYGASAHLRELIARDGVAIVRLDLAPDRDVDALATALARPRGKRSLAEHLRRRAGISGVKLALLHELLAELLAGDVLSDPARLAAAIKAVPLRLLAVRAMAEAISTAGGVRFGAVDDNYMLRERAGVFVAGEMLDWEAPTGGYLLTACLATGRAAGKAALDWAQAHAAAGNTGR